MNRYMDSDDEGSAEERKRAAFKRGLFEDNSDEEEEKRQVRSQKEKKWEAIATHSDKIRRSLKIQDFCTVQAEFDSLLKKVENSATLVAAEGLPPSFIRTLVRIEDEMGTVNKEQQKKFNKNNSKAFTKLRQQLRKTSVTYEEPLIVFRENPLESEEESEQSDEDTEKSSEEEQGNEDDDSEQWGSGGSESEESADERPSEDLVERRKFWLKRAGKEEEQKQTKPKKPNEPRAKPEHAAPVKAEYTQEMILDKLKEIQENRGRASVYLTTTIEALHEMMDSTEDERLLLQILQVLLPALLDSHKNVVSAVIPRASWLRIVAYIDQAIKLAGDADLFKGLGGCIERMFEENYKALKQTDGNSDEYLARIRDQTDLNWTINKAAALCKGPARSKLSLLLLRLLYTVPDETIHRMREHYEGPHTGLYFQTCSPSELVDSELRHILDNKDQRDVALGIILVATHHAVNGRYSAGSQLAASLEFTEEVQEDPLATTLYNRLLTHLALAAFSEGNLHLSYIHLHELINSGRMAELIGQSFMPHKEQKVNKEELRRSVPVHMHIRSQVIELAYLVSALILETPTALCDRADNKSTVISSFFKKLLENAGKDLYKGPTQSLRDQVAHCYKWLAEGDWPQAVQIVARMDSWKYIKDSQRTIEKLTVLLKEVALLCYVIKDAYYYNNLSKKALATKFAITEDSVVRVLEDKRLQDHALLEWAGDCAQLTLKNIQMGLLVSSLQAKCELLSKEDADTFASQGFLTATLQNSVIRQKFNPETRKKIISFTK